MVTITINEDQATLSEDNVSVELVMKEQSTEFLAAFHALRTQSEMLFDVLSKPEMELQKLADEVDTKMVRMSELERVVYGSRK